MTGPNLWVIDKTGLCLRKIVARPGLKTTWGVITRVSPKSIWTRRPDGSERLHSGAHGLPSIYQSYAPKA